MNIKSLNAFVIFCLFIKKSFKVFSTCWAVKQKIMSMQRSCSCYFSSLSNSYTMACLSVRGDNPRALASGLSYVQVDKHGITILYHLRQCRLCTS